MSSQLGLLSGCHKMSWKLAVIMAADITTSTTVAAAAVPTHKRHAWEASRLTPSSHHI